MELNIYTDARAGLSKVIQIGAVAVDENDNEFHFVEKTSVGLIKNKWSEFVPIKFKANSTIGEMYSIYKILLELSKLEISKKNINIYTDSLGSFNFINSVSKTPDGDVGDNPFIPKCALTKKINSEIRTIKKQLKLKGINIEIMWIKGHDGCYFNEVVDKLCKSKSDEVNNFKFIKD